MSNGFDALNQAQAQNRQLREIIKSLTAVLVELISLIPPDDIEWRARATRLYHEIEAVLENPSPPQ